MTKTMAAAKQQHQHRRYHRLARVHCQPRKVIAEKLFTAYGFKSASAATSSALEPIDGDWNLSKVLKKIISESEEEEKDATKTTKWLSIPEINHADGKGVGIESVPEGKLCRFRCVVQDMRDPEYYVGCFKSKRASSGGRRRSSRNTAATRRREWRKRTTRSVCLHSRTRSSSLRTFGCGRGRCSIASRYRAQAKGAVREIVWRERISTRTAMGW